METTQNQLLSKAETDKKYQECVRKFPDHTRCEDEDITRFLLSIPGLEITFKEVGKRVFTYNNVEFDIFVNTLNIHLYLKSDPSKPIECFSDKNALIKDLYDYLKKNYPFIPVTTTNTTEQYQFITDQLCDAQKQKMTDEINDVYNKYLIGSCTIGKELFNIVSSKIVTTQSNCVSFDYHGSLYNIRFENHSKILTKAHGDIEWREIFVFNNIANLESIIAWDVEVNMISDGLNELLNKEKIMKNDYVKIAELSQKLSKLVDKTPEYV